MKSLLYVAKRIGGTLLSIPQLMRQDKIEIEDDAVGIVAPCYAVEMPMMVKKFLEKSQIRTEYFFFIYTYGSGTGADGFSENRCSVRYHRLCSVWACMVAAVQEGGQAMIWIELFLTFLKIGAFTFGGGYAMLPLIQSEVEHHGWLTQAEVVDFIAVSESTPGPLAINMATFVGIRTGGVFGAVCATLGVVLPSFVIILIVAKFYEKFRKSRSVDGVMYGLRPAVIGLIGAAFLSVGMTVFFPNGLNNSVFSGAGFWLSLGIFALGAVLAFKKPHPIAIIGISAVIGIIAGYALGL